MPPWASVAQQAITIESNRLELISGCEAEPKLWDLPARVHQSFEPQQGRLQPNKLRPHSLTCKVRAEAPIQQFGLLVVVRTRSTRPTGLLTVREASHRVRVRFVTLSSADMVDWEPGIRFGRTLPPPESRQQLRAMVVHDRIYRRCRGAVCAQPRVRLRRQRHLCLLSIF